MGAIHELFDDYRHYRQAHPEYRLLFLLGDLVTLLLKLAVFAGFLYLCWYLVSRNPQGAEALVPQSKNPVSQKAEATPELTDERIALLEGIASGNPAPELIGSVVASNGAKKETSAPVISKAFVQASFDESSVSSPIQAPAQTLMSLQTVPTTVVQVESRPGRAVRSGYTEIDDIPTVVAVIEKPVASESKRGFKDKIFVPPENIEDGSWVFDQNAADYTLQLALTVNVDFLVRFAEKLPSEHVAAIYPERLNRNQGIQYSLILGSFPNRRSAEQLLASLPAALKRYGAHARGFDEAQQNAKSFLQ